MRCSGGQATPAARSSTADNARSYPATAGASRIASASRARICSSVAEIAAGVGVAVVSACASLAWTSAVRFPERRSLVLEGSAGSGRVERDDPAVACAGQEFLCEREVPDGAAADGAAVGPIADDVADRRRHRGRTGFGERRLELDVGVVAVMERPEHLADHRSAVALQDDRGVGLLAGQHPAADQPAGSPSPSGHAHPVAVDLGAFRDELQERHTEAGIVRCVVDAAAVLEQLDLGVLAGQRLRSVGQRHLVQRGLARRMVDEQVHDVLDAGIRRGKGPAADLLESRHRALVRVPALVRHPARECSWDAGGHGPP